MNADGHTTIFPIAEDSFAQRLTAGPDNAIWFTDPANGRIGRLAYDGQLAYVKLPNSQSGPSGIAAGSDGMIYFAEHAASRIGRMSTKGVLTEFTLRPGSGPAGVASTSSAVYFTEDKANKIGRIDKSGKITEFTLPTLGAVPGSIAAAPDGSVYFNEMAARKVGRLSPDGQITEFALPAGPGAPLGIAVSTDSNVWVTIPRENAVYRMTGGRASGEFKTSRDGPPAFIGAASGGDVYFTELDNHVTRVTSSGEVTEFNVAPPRD